MQLPSESIHRGYKIHFFEEINSTNDYAWNYVANNTPNDKIVIIAAHQTAGKGQYDRKWVADKGKNITMSVIMALQDWKLKDAFHLNIIVSVSILKAIHRIEGMNLAVKWPNDIYYEEKKLGGILIKNRVIRSLIEHTVIGIGLNVNQDKFDTSIPNPVSLNLILNKTLSLEQLMKAVLSELSDSFECAKSKGIKEMHMYYVNHLFGKGQYRKYRINSERKTLAIVGVEDSGDIILREENGTLYKMNSGLEYIF